MKILDTTKAIRGRVAAATIVVSGFSRSDVRNRNGTELHTLRLSAKRSRLACTTASRLKPLPSNTLQSIEEWSVAIAGNHVRGRAGILPAVPRILRGTPGVESGSFARRTPVLRCMHRVEYPVRRVKYPPYPAHIIPAANVFVLFPVPSASRSLLLTTFASSRAFTFSRITRAVVAQATSPAAVLTGDSPDCASFRRNVGRVARQDSCRRVACATTRHRSHLANA